MGLLRNTKKLEIQEAIEKSGYFTIDDFDINLVPSKKVWVN